MHTSWRGAVSCPQSNLSLMSLHRGEVSLQISDHCDLSSEEGAVCSACRPRRSGGHLAVSGARRSCLAQALHLVRHRRVAADLQHAEGRALLLVVAVRPSVAHRRQQHQRQNKNNQVQETHFDNLSVYSHTKLTRKSFVYISKSTVRE